MSQDFKKLVEENKKQTSLLNKIIGEEGTENVSESLEQMQSNNRARMQEELHKQGMRLKRF